MSDVKFLRVVSKDGSTAAERFAAMTKNESTFYIVGNPAADLYLGDKKISNAADLAALSGTVDTVSAAVTLLNNTEETEGSVRNIVATYLDELTASDIAITDAAGNFSSDDVEGALAELASATGGGVASKTVYITTVTGGTSDTYGKRYGIYQGSSGSSASPVVSELLANIDIPKDMVVESGSVETVVTPDVPYAGAQVGDKYIDLVIANATSDHIYIPANSLVDIYTAEASATQIQLAIDSNNEISATIVAGSVTATELATDAVVTAKIEDEAVTEAKLSQAVQTKLNAAVGVTAVAEGTTNGTVSVTTNGTTADVAVHGLASAAYEAATSFDAAGSASAVLGTSSDTSTANTVYGAKAAAADASTAASTADGKAVAAQNDVDALETLVGTLPSGISATTVTGYVAEAVGTALTWEEV